MEDPKATLERIVNVEDLKAALEKIADVDPLEAVLEIGAGHGYSARFWLDSVGATGRVVSVDLRNRIWPTMNFDSRWELIVGNSTDLNTVATVAQRAPFDLLLIDGDHRREFLACDWAFYSPFVRPGGVVLFHDILHPLCLGARTFWLAFKESHECETFAWDKCGVGVVRITG